MRLPCKASGKIECFAGAHSDRPGSILYRVSDASQQATDIPGEGMTETSEPNLPSSFLPADGPLRQGVGQPISRLSSGRRLRAPPHAPSRQRPDQNAPAPVSTAERWPKDAAIRRPPPARCRQPSTDIDMAPCARADTVRPKGDIAFCAFGAIGQYNEHNLRGPRAPGCQSLIRPTGQKAGGQLGLRRFGVA